MPIWTVICKNHSIICLVYWVKTFANTLRKGELVIRYGELDQAIIVYTKDNAHETIPIEYYRQVIKLAVKMNNDGKQWDMQQSAAILLFLAYSDAHILSTQLTGCGLDSLDYAEKLLLDNGLSIEQVDNISKVSQTG